MILTEYESGVAVFSQGDVGREWFIILSGQVMIQITKTGMMVDMFKICSLTTGAGFGELALINDAPRTASVVTEIRTELIRVDKWDYDRIMKCSHENDVKEKILFLKRTEPFRGWDEGSIKKIAQEAKWRRFKIGETIYTIGQKLTDVYFVRKGYCNVMADYEMVWTLS
jgi:CRP-like cAMP-binding protein